MSPFDIEDEALPGVLRVVLSALTALRQRAASAALEDAIRRGDAQAVLDEINLDLMDDTIAAELWPRLRAVMEQSFPTALTDTPQRALEQIADAERVSGASVAVRFDLVSPHVQQEIEARAAQRVVEITEETRASPRDAVARAYDSGNPREAAQEIRQIVGLNRRLADAVDRYREQLVAAGTPAARVERMVERYAKKLTKYRADMIARTEANRAMNDGRTARWRDAIAKGLLDPSRWVRQWMAVLDSDRTCPECMEANGTLAPIEGLFPNGTDGPPLHPMCRCTTRLVSRDE